MVKSWYLVARKLRDRSFISADPAIDVREKAEALARRYAADTLWTGAELVVIDRNGIELERVPIEKM